MFSQHPFTLGHRYALDARPALPLWKRAIDVICCLACLPLLALLTFVFAIIAKVAARGPVFYRQENAGYMGRHFRVFRFRTMRAASQTILPGMLAETPVDETQRGLFIPGGRYLRLSGLADLPQIVNVLRGEMSIVGPRPRLDAFTGRTGVPLSENGVLPGLTGLWRVANQDVETRDTLLRWERHYSERMSFWSDLSIIAQTPLRWFAWRRVR